MKLSGVRVLLAEDNATNQMVAIQMLESLGASVTLARDGAEALEIVEREDFDVMLIDIEMPRVSGIDVIRRLRASSGPQAELPMIALTAYVMREHRAAIDAAGADGIIAKPILSIEQLGADIWHFMRSRTAPGKAAGDSNEAGGSRPIIDEKVYETLARAIGPSAMVELLGKVESDVQSARERLESAREARDIAEVRSASHILISVAGAVGALQVQEAARRLNTAAHHSDFAKIEGSVPALLDDIGRMLEFLKKRLNE